MRSLVVSSIALAWLAGCQQSKAPVPVEQAGAQPVSEPADDASTPAVAVDVDVDVVAVAVAPALPERGIAGVATDEDGAPIGGARVCAWTKRPPIEVVREEMLTPICADVDGRGGYALELGAGVWRIIASAAECQPSQVEVVLRDVSPQQSVDHLLAPGGRVFRGRVVDNFGRPVAHARVTAQMGMPPRDRGFVQTQTAADGRFELWASHYGWLWIHAPGFAYDFFVPDGDDYVLVPESRVRGRVVDDEGKPVAGARVAVRDEYGPYGNREDAMRTDAAGAFELVGLAPAAIDVVALTTEGYGLVKVDLGYTEVEDVVVRLERWPTLRLQVVEPDVGPVAMCAVNVAPARGDAEDRGEQYWTDQEGEIEVALRPGRYRIAYIACLDKVATPPFAPLDLRRRSASAKIEVTAGRTLRGIARMPGGQPLAHEQLWVRPSKLEQHIRPATITTDASGHFEFHGLVQGTHTFNGPAWMSRFRMPMPTAWVSDEPVSEVEVEFPASGRIEVQSSRAGWSQMARLRLCEARGESWSDHQRSDGQGRAVFEHVPLGEIIVSIEDSPYCSDKAATRVQVGEGDRHRVEIVVEEPKTTSVVVHVEGPGGEPFAGALVQVGDEGAHRITSYRWGGLDGKDCALTDADGVARVELEAGTKLERIEVLAPGMVARYGQPEADPDFDFGDEEDEGGYIEWPGLKGSEFTVRLAPRP